MTPEQLLKQGIDNQNWDDIAKAYKAMTTKKQPRVERKINPKKKKSINEFDNDPIKNEFKDERHGYIDGKLTQPIINKIPRPTPRYVQVSCSQCNKQFQIHESMSGQRFFLCKRCENSSVPIINKK